MVAHLQGALRNTSRLEGKCGACEYKEICGGSRARAYALTGDPLAQEPCCIYQPKNWDRSLGERRTVFPRSGNLGIAGHALKRIIIVARLECSDPLPHPFRAFCEKGWESQKAEFTYPEIGLAS